VRAQTTPSKTTAGAVVNDAETPEQVLAAAALVVLPGEESAPHERQDVHKMKRATACSLALRRLVKMLVGVKREETRANVTRTPEFARLVAGALADRGSAPGDDAKAMDLFVETARALGSLAPFEMERASAELLVATAEAYARSGGLSAKSATPVAWSLARFGLDVSSEISDLLRGIPFKFEPNLTAGLIDLETLRREVAFRREKLTTRDGRQVDERRETCWMGEDGVGSYAYSGKVMQPTPMPPCVVALRDALEEKTGERFDCALVNLYPNETAACAYHTDPGMGVGFATDSIIVSIGETRRFSFRPLGSTDAESHWVRVHDGDAISMFANCNDDFEHCVMKAESDENDGPRASIVFKRCLAKRRTSGGGGARKKKPSRKSPSSASASSSTRRGGRGARRA
jgi:alkylated DNA repair dioxygenase AlkB